MLHDPDEHGLDLISKHTGKSSVDKTPSTGEDLQGFLTLMIRSTVFTRMEMGLYACVCVPCHHGSLAVRPRGDERSLTHAHTPASEGTDTSDLC